jgi:hypothetical protein
MASKPPPSTGVPAGVPPSGNGKYVALAVLLLGGVGALIAWRSCQQPDPPVVVTVPQDAGPVQPVRDLDDEIPLPPPIEDAGPEDASKKKVSTALASQCDAKTCTGAATQEVKNALAFRAKQAHRCYDTALAQDPTLRGKVSIAVRIGANGTVCSSSVASNDMGMQNVATCVANAFRGSAMPLPKGGCIDVNVPINFVPRQ